MPFSRTEVPCWRSARWSLTTGDSSYCMSIGLQCCSEEPWLPSGSLQSSFTIYQYGQIWIWQMKKNLLRHLKRSYQCKKWSLLEKRCGSPLSVLQFCKQMKLVLWCSLVRDQKALWNMFVLVDFQPWALNLRWNGARCRRNGIYYWNGLARILPVVGIVPSVSLGSTLITDLLLSALALGSMVVAMAVFHLSLPHTALELTPQEGGSDGILYAVGFALFEVTILSRIELSFVSCLCFEYFSSRLPYHVMRQNIFIIWRWKWSGGRSSILIWDHLYRTVFK